MHFRRSKILEPRGKVVFITGCDTGFGNLLARRLDVLGFVVLAGCLDANSQGARALVRETSRVQTVQVDVTSDHQVQAALEIVTVRTQEQGGLWSLINNAGIAVFTECEWCPMDTYRRSLEVNLVGTIRVTKAFLPLVRQTRGRVVNVASLAGRVGLPGFTAYSATKHGVVGFSDCLRREMVKFKVNVVTIEPNMYRTPMAERSMQLGQAEQSWATTPQHIRDDYGEQYFHTFHATLKTHLSFSSKRIHEVIDCLEHAVIARHPKSRYVPGRTMCLLSNLFGALPNCIQDVAVIAAMKANVRPQCMD
ncbi:17-beta-hydroxysteroid dehydrogenase type 6 [Mizuhopecten yessoensis]|uniref:17-beta-hydroxysteroid dehydrogenase type 6 n=2 Tax=Mizuhopecten yessoensis TaxID=6573 RepID=A0A210QKZ3_MIZYE|nr:17-beta-hydroxysteroid dehydrogenase type 6 [Mizuhopecten yessoensis]